MNRALCRLLWLVLLLPLVASAQTQPDRVTFQGFTIYDSGGSTPLLSGQICALTTDASDRPMGYRVGRASGQTSAAVSQAPCAVVTNGISTPLQLINSDSSSPANACLRITTFDASGAEIRRSKCVQTGAIDGSSWCSASAGIISCNWDLYGVGTAPVPLVQVGPQGLPGISYAASAVVAAQMTASSTIQSQRTAFSDGTPFWKAGGNYNSSFSADTYVAFESQADQFSATQINGVAHKFVAAASASVGNAMPFALNPDGTPLVFYSGWDQLHHHATAEPELFVPLMFLQAYRKSGDISAFAADAAAIDAAMASLQVNGSTHLLTVNAGDDYVPFGFMEQVRLRGDVTTGSVMLWRAYKALATLNAAAGNTASAASYSTKAAQIQASLTTSSPLWNGAGIFNAATSTNKQPDVIGSALAVYSGLVSGAQATAISNWLAANFSTIERSGFFRESNADWSLHGTINADGSFGGDFGFTAGQYQNGYWAVANTWILEALQASSPALAAQAVNDWQAAGSTIQTTEWLNVNDSLLQGSAVQLVTPMGFASYVSRHSGDFAAPTSAPALPSLSFLFGTGPSVKLQSVGLHFLRFLDASDATGKSYAFIEPKGIRIGSNWAGAGPAAAGRTVIMFNEPFAHTPTCHFDTANGAAEPSTKAYTTQWLAFDVPELAFVSYSCEDLETDQALSPAGPQVSTTTYKDAYGNAQTASLPAPGFSTHVAVSAAAQRMNGLSILSNWEDSGIVGPGDHKIVFAPAFSGTPSCIVQTANGAPPPTNVVYTGGSTGSLTISIGGSANVYVSYQCHEVANRTLP